MTERSFKGEVIIPAGQSIITGIFIGVMGAGIATLAESHAMTWGITTAAIGATGVYLLKTSNPKITVKPPTRKFAEDVNINVANWDQPFTKGKREKIRHKRLLPKMAREVKIMDANFCYADLSGKGKVFSRGQYEQVRTDMLKCGFLYWKDRNTRTAGMGFTRGGMAFIDHQYKKILTSPPRQPRVREKLAPAL